MKKTILLAFALLSFVGAVAQNNNAPSSTRQRLKILPRAKRFKTKSLACFCIGDCTR